MTARRYAVPFAAGAIALIAFFLHSSPLGDLSNGYTDHLRHMGESVVFVQKGFALYRQTYAAACEGVRLPCPDHAGLWPEISSPYPPLGVLAHWPVAALESSGALAPATAHRTMVFIWLLVGFFAALLAWRLGAAQPVICRVGIALIAMPLLIGMGENGFFDVAFVAAGIAGLLALQSRRPSIALVLFGLCAAFHFRALAFAPFAIAAAWQSRRWQPVAGAAALALPAFAAAAIVAPLATEPTVANPVYFTHLRWSLPLAAASITAAAVLWRTQHRFCAASVLVSAAMMAIDRAHCWWHAAVLLPPALGLAIDDERRARVHAVAWAWVVAVALLAWRHPLGPFWQWIEFAIHGVH